MTTTPAVVYDGFPTFECNATLEAFRRLKRDANGKVGYAGLGEEHFGVSLQGGESGDFIPVAIRGTTSEVIFTASAAVLINAALYGAANGKVSSTQAGGRIGTAKAAASADNSRFVAYDAYGADAFQKIHTVTAGEDAANQADIDTGFGAAPTGAVLVHIESTANVMRNPAGAVTFLAGGDLGKVRIVDAGLAVDEKIHVIAYR